MNNIKKRITQLTEKTGFLVGLVVVGVIILSISTFFVVKRYSDEPALQNPEYSSDALANAELNPEEGKEGEYSHYLTVANNYKYEGNHEKAREFYEKALNLFPEDEQRRAEIALASYEVYKELGEEQEYMKKLKEGVVALENSLEDQPSPYAAVRIADLYNELGNLKKTEQYYLLAKKQALELDTVEQEFMDALNQRIEALDGQDE